MSNPQTTLGKQADTKESNPAPPKRGCKNKEKLQYYFSLPVHAMTETAVHYYISLTDGATQPSAGCNFYYQVKGLPNSTPILFLIPKQQHTDFASYWVGPQHPACDA